jgi:hypothetical protein
MRDQVLTGSTFDKGLVRIAQSIAKRSKVELAARDKQLMGRKSVLAGVYKP